MVKVFFGNLDGRNNALVAAKSKAEAARLLGLSIGYFNSYFSQCSNQEYIRQAMTEPKRVFKRSNTDWDGDWR